MRRLPLVSALALAVVARRLRDRPARRRRPPPPAAGRARCRASCRATSGRSIMRSRSPPDAANLRFSGIELIDIEVLEPTDAITLNAADSTSPRST